MTYTSHLLQHCNYSTSVELFLYALIFASIPFFTCALHATIHLCIIIIPFCLQIFIMPFHALLISSELLENGSMIVAISIQFKQMGNTLHDIVITELSRLDKRYVDHTITQQCMYEYNPIKMCLKQLNALLDNTIDGCGNHKNQYNTKYREIAKF